MPPKINNLTDKFFVIDLQSCPIDKIVAQKLSYFLENNHVIKSVFEEFYSPIEKSVLEFCLTFLNKNQSRVAQSLNINRNTLKRKLQHHNIDIKNLFSVKEYLPLIEKRIYFADLKSLDLLKISRLKLCFLKKKQDFIDQNPLESFCKPVEKVLVKSSLNFFKDNQLRTSLFLNINRNTLKKKLTGYNTEVRV